MRKIKITKIILGNLVCIGAITPLLTSCDTQEEDVTTYTLYFFVDPAYGHLEGGENQIVVEENTKWEDILKRSDMPKAVADADGYIFDDWYYNGKALQPEDVISSDNMTIKAMFKKAFTPDTDFEWATDGIEAKIVEFKGTETDVLIPTIHTEGGKEYRVTSIGDSAFKDNVTLSSVVIPELNFKTIGNSAFEGCTNLTSINLPKSLKTIGNSAFEATKLSSIVIPDGIETVNDGTFKECTSLSSITFSNTITSIGNSAFEGCTSLSFDKLPKSITSIGKSAFEGCAEIKSLNIPTTITEIGNFAFKNCAGISEIKYNDVYDNWKKITFGEQWHSGLLITLVNCSDGDYHIDPEIYTLNYSAGPNGSLVGETQCLVTEATKWKNVPNKPTPVPNDPNIYSFDDWYHNGVELHGDDIILSSMDIEARFILKPTPATSFEWKVNDETGEATILKYKGQETSLVIPRKYILNGKTYFVTEISNSAFKDCTSFSSLVLPDTLKTVGDTAFWGCNFTSLDIPNSVRTIGEDAFAYCPSLSQIHIPNTVEQFGTGVFRDCKALTSITLPDNMTRTTDHMLQYCALTSITFPANFETIGSRSLEGNLFTSFYIPISVKTIENGALRYCENLSYVQYQGTMAQWRKMNVYSDWYECTYVTKVVCSDGEITLDPDFPDMSTNGNTPSH